MSGRESPALTAYQVSVAFSSLTNERFASPDRIVARRLPQKALLLEIATERRKLCDLIDSVPKRRLTMRGMNSANWSIKDVMAHLFDWENRVNDWYEVGRAGGIPATPGDGFNWNQTRELNELIYKRHRRKSIQTISSEFQAGHARTVVNIEKMNDLELTTISFYSWTGKSWSLSDYIRANTASHYRWAYKKIRRWLKQLEAVDS